MALLDDYLTLDELAEELSVHPRTIRRWGYQPDGIPHTKIGKRRLYRMDAVKQWLDQAEVRPNKRRVAK